MAVHSFAAGHALNDVCGDAQKIVDDALDQRRKAIIELLARCESPIEQVLVAALWDRWQCSVADNRVGMDAWLEAGGYADPPQRLTVEIQKRISTVGQQYRADIFIALPQLLGGIADAPLVVECDGHDFHERTRSQAARDRKRDRDMLGQGMRVVRFTGSEISTNPAACVEELIALMLRARQ